METYVIEITRENTGQKGYLGFGGKLVASSDDAKPFYSFGDANAICNCVGGGIVRAVSK